MFFGMRRRRRERQRWPPGDSPVRPDHYLFSSLWSCSLPLTVRDFNWPSSSTSTRSCPFSTILQQRRPRRQRRPSTPAGALASELQIPFCGDLPAVDELGGGGHGSEVARGRSSASPHAAEGRGEGGDSSARLWEGAETWGGAAVRGRRGPPSLQRCAPLLVPTLIEPGETHWKASEPKGGPPHPAPAPTPLATAPADKEIIEGVVGCEGEHSGGEREASGKLCFLSMISSLELKHSLLQDPPPHETWCWFPRRCSITGDGSGVYWKATPEEPKTTLQGAASVASARVLAPPPGGLLLCLDISAPRLREVCVNSVFPRASLQMAI